jgi:HEAT repeat protein
VRRLLSTPILFDARRDKAMHAAEAFTALGETAAPAIHELEVRSQNSESPDKSFYAFLALSHIRPTAAAAMSRVLANSDLAHDRFKMQFIGMMGTNAQPLVPTLVRNLEGTNIFVAEACAEALGLLALEPDLCIPALTNKLADPYTLVRLGTVQALAGFGPRALPALPHLTNALSDPDPAVRGTAAYAITRITAPQ